jgi:hypothetical protein
VNHIGRRTILAMLLIVALVICGIFRAVCLMDVKIQNGLLPPPRENVVVEHPGRTPWHRPP